MKKILYLILTLLVSTVSISADVTTGVSVEEIPLTQRDANNNENNSHNKGSRIPARVPLSCFLMENCLTVICEYEANMEITVTNNATGEIVAHEISDLTTSLSLYISDYTSGAMEVSIEMDGKTFVGYF